MRLTTVASPRLRRWALCRGESILLEDEEVGEVVLSIVCGVNENPVGDGLRPGEERERRS